MISKAGKGTTSVFMSLADTKNKGFNYTTCTNMEKNYKCLTVPMVD